jgi:dihydropteroate synthase
MQGNPQTMQQSPDYKDVVKEVFEFLRMKMAKAKSFGIMDVIVDPGFGFGKTVEHNFSLLKNLSLFSMLDAPVLAGLSRKSMICKTLEVNPANALNGTTALNMLALLNGASILRVHDVKEAMQCVKLFEVYNKN